MLDIDFIISLSSSELVELLKPLFSDDNSVNNCTLDRLEERSEFIINIAKIIKEKFLGKAESLIKLSQGYLINNGKGLYELLDYFVPYSTDPLKKKSTAFVKFLEEANLIRIQDPENFIPIIDYHAQRVMLRMGCVEIMNLDLKEKLQKMQEIDSDIVIRSNCVDAIRIIAEESGFSIPQIDDFFWSLGRSCCKEMMLCRDGICNKKPCTFNSIIDLSEHNNCIFENTCEGSKNDEYAKFWQPIVKTNFY